MAKHVEPGTMEWLEHQKQVAPRHACIDPISAIADGMSVARVWNLLVLKKKRPPSAESYPAVTCWL